MSASVKVRRRGLPLWISLLSAAAIMLVVGVVGLVVLVLIFRESSRDEVSVPSPMPLPVASPATSLPTTPVAVEDMKLAEFVIKKPEKAVRVRVRVRFDIKNQTDPTNPHYSLMIRQQPSPGSFYDVKHALVVKNTRWGKRLWELLQDGSEREMTLWLQFVRIKTWEKTPQHIGVIDIASES